MTTVPQAAAGYHDVIVRAAQDPNFDVDKLERLVAMQEAQQQRQADQLFNEAHAAAEAEMETINTDANNPQTRSKYATFAQVDRAARPIYTKHGFAISFTTEPMGTPDNILVVGTLSHRLGGSKRYQVPVPIVTKGFRGTEMMTPIHATMAAISYGKRNLEIMMFNLAIGEDSDGNAPRRPPSFEQTAKATGPKLGPTEYIDLETGELVSLAHPTPGMIEWSQAFDSWGSWGQRFAAHLRTSANLDELQQWQDLNKSKLDQMGQEKPATAANMQAAIAAFRKSLA